MLKPLGYATGQFGKNHLGDLNKYLPTAHGFDEFFGNLYHLNAEEDPEQPNYPPEKDFPEFRKKFGPSGVIRSWAIDKDDSTEMPRWGRVGKQRIEDTGSLTKKRMETIDDETVATCKDFIKRQHADGKPFFAWMNTTHMHCFTHTKPSSLGQAGRWQSLLVEKLKKGHKAGDKTFKVHIDGFNLLPFLTTKDARSPRQGFIYFSDDGDLVAMRFDNWKVVFKEQRMPGTLAVWAEPFIPLRLPKLFNLRTIPSNGQT